MRMKLVVVYAELDLQREKAWSKLRDRPLELMVCMALTNDIKRPPGPRRSGGTVDGIFSLGNSVGLWMKNGLLPDSKSIFSIDGATRGFCMWTNL
ncbi:hypothetical protein BaRGS_00010573 [Batillaria attramentaria]|uniref:Uncharacterized protein n=1 Tax=Batillaria attramentaria TaxID=370345 RepID=A0ABD0LGF2_9CAEN